MEDRSLQCGPDDRAYPECFDTHGVETLAFDAPPDLVVMDELGIMEKEAHGFQKRVLEIMESDLNILCVIKNKSNPFLDQVKEKADTIFNVNPQTANASIRMSNNASVNKKDRIPCLVFYNP